MKDKGGHFLPSTGERWDPAPQAPPSRPWIPGHVRDDEWRIARAQKPRSQPMTYERAKPVEALNFLNLSPLVLPEYHTHFGVK